MVAHQVSFIWKGASDKASLSPFLFLIVAKGLNLITNRAIHQRLLEPFVFRSNGLSVSHLQYADDTVFVASGKSENAWVLKSILKIFEALSGLKVNFDKSNIFGIGVPSPLRVQMANTLNCQVGEFPTKFLGILIGARLSRVAEWSYLVEKIKRKIKFWQNRKLSFAGRITLLRSSDEWVFVGGEGTEGRKIHWVKWEDLGEDVREGGLGIKDLESFNKALMAKWIWRLLTERESFWVRVVQASKGEIGWDGEGLCFEKKREVKSWWWKRVVSLSGGDGGKWLRDNLMLKVGEGDSIQFWNHCWVGGKSLKERFPSLFRLSGNQEGYIKNMGSWVEGVWEWKLEWTRDLRGRDLSHASNLLACYQSFQGECRC
ncbi:uncharacterized protein LOC131023384 [Salvia miltiorrhiza]|uniref:uncharacterized protein LOC131023384 n=1 Tax=Salvia miltiorrhiza TaxID=226208 RepID=UPI0025AD4AE7|nr:uncharacterized protein LOC131023384 [Salvia miltiorrhiza]